MKFYKSVFLMVLMFIISCKKEEVKEIPNHVSTNAKTNIKKLNTAKTNLNISVLLDLSDRIDPKKYPNPTMEFYERDLGYIQSITTSFENHILHKKTRAINDKIQLFVAPEPSDTELNSKIASLKIHFDRFNAKKEKIKATTDIYKGVGKEIYEKAISDGKFVGSNIFGFFKNNINNYCVAEDYRNIMIILTDGYIYHKDYVIKDKNRTSYITPKVIRNSKLNTNKWEAKFKKGDYGFLPINQNLEKLEVLVLGINTNKNNPFEADVIQTYWAKWLQEMNINKFAIKSADLPIHLEDIINDFIRNE